MKKIVAAIFTAFAVIGAASAQAQTPAKAPAAVSAAPAAAAAPVDPAALAASRELFEAMNQRVMLTVMMQQMSQGIGQSMRGGAEAAINANPNNTPEQKKQALAKMEAELPGVVGAMQGVLNDPTMIDDILAETVPLYARTFSADEIKQMTAFYRTPVGAKMLATMPQLMSQGMQIGQQVVMRRVGPLMQKLQPQEGKQ
jgi:hypothetical protein